MEEKGRNSGKATNQAREHAFDFCLAIDPVAAFRTIANRIWDIAGSDEAVAARFAAIQEKVGSGRPVIEDEHSALFDRLKDRRTVLDLTPAPEMFRPLFVAAYLRAKQTLAQGGGRGIFADFDKRLDQVEKLLDQLEPKFVGELLTEVTLSARSNPTFAKQLQTGASELRALAEELYGPDLSERPAALARASSNSGGSCTCCSTVNGNRTCEPCSCWIIVIVIIIVIVAK